MKRLEGKVAVITGSSTGIGKACAIRFAEEGASVVINDFEADDSLAKEVLEIIRNKGGKAEYFRADVRSKSSLRDLIDFSIKLYGKINVLVNNAVAFHGENHADPDENVWENLHLSTILAILRASEFTIPEMKKVGGGSIINLSSIHGLLGGRDSLAYATFKGAVLNMTRKMAVDYGNDNIRVNALCPGRIVTERKVKFLEENPEEYRRQKATYPLGRPGTLLEIANAALFLASDESSFITGHALVVDGGLTIQLQDSVAIPIEKGISDELKEQGIIWP